MLLLAVCDRLISEVLTSGQVLSEVFEKYFCLLMRLVDII